MIWAGDCISGINITYAKHWKCVLCSNRHCIHINNKGWLCPMYLTLLRLESYGYQFNQWLVKKTKANNLLGIQLSQHHQVRVKTLQQNYGHWCPGPIFTNRHVLPPNLSKSRSREIACCNDRIALKFNTHFGSSGCRGACQMIERLEIT